MNNSNILKLLKAPLLGSLFFIISWVLFRALTNALLGTYQGNDIIFTAKLFILWKQFLANFAMLLFAAFFICLAFFQYQNKVVVLTVSNTIKLMAVMLLCTLLLVLVSFAAIWIPLYIIKTYGDGELTYFLYLNLGQKLFITISAAAIVYPLTFYFIKKDIFQVEECQLTNITICRWTNIILSGLLVLFTLSAVVRYFIFSTGMFTRTYLGSYVWTIMFEYIVYLLIVLINIPFLYGWIQKFLPKNLPSIDGRRIILSLVYTQLFSLVWGIVLVGVLYLVIEILFVALGYYNFNRLIYQLVAILYVVNAILLIGLIYSVPGKLFRIIILIVWASISILICVFLWKTQEEALVILGAFWFGIMLNLVGAYLCIKYAVKLAFKPLYSEVKG